MKNVNFSMPKVLADERVRDLLRKKRDQYNVRSLNKWVDGLRKKKGKRYGIPYFDPNDGGKNATVLFLLEAPGPQATGSGFISRNNNDDTAANMLDFLQKSRFKREETILWNVVPWYVGDGRNIRAVTARDHDDAHPYLEELLKLLPDLRTVVLVGKKAQRELKYLQKSHRQLNIFLSPHPSPRNINSRPDCRKNITGVFKKAWSATRRPRKRLGKDSKIVS